MPRGGVNSAAYRDWRSPIAEVELRRLYELHSQTEIAALLGISLKRVQTAMRRFGIQPRRQIKREQTGPNNSYWKGDGAKYQALHVRVARRRGKPSRCSRCGSENEHGVVYEWANLTGRYEDVDDYERMCRSCHRRYDNSRRPTVG